MRLRAFIANVVVLLVSGSLALVASEFAVRFLAPQNLSGSWFVEAPTGPYMVNKSSGTARHQFGQRIVQYSFTAPHLRAPAGTGRQKVLVLGDSFTFGLLLADEHTYVQHLQVHADRALGEGAIGFLNAGIGGSGTADQLAFYEDFAPSTGAQMILVFLNTDDIGRSLRSAVYSLDASSGSLARNHEPMRSSRVKTLLNSLPFYNLALENSHLLQLTRLAMLGFPRAGKSTETTPFTHSAPEDRAKSERMGAALFTRFAKLARENGHRLIVVTTGWHRFKASDAREPNPDASEPTAAFMAIAPELFARLGVPFFDITDRLYARVEGDVARIAIPGDGHPNEYGAELIADTVWEAIAPVMRGSFPAVGAGPTPQLVR